MIQSTLHSNKVLQCVMQSAYRKALCLNKKIANYRARCLARYYAQSVYCVVHRAPAFYRRARRLKTVGVRVFESHRARHYLSKDNESRNQSGSSMSNALVMSLAEWSDSVAFILVARLLPIPGMTFH